MSLDIAHATLAHVPGIAKLISRQTLEYYFPDLDVAGAQHQPDRLVTPLVGECYLPLVVLNESDKIVGFACLDDSPPAFTSDSREDWLNDFLARHDTQKFPAGDPNRSLFLTYFVVTGDLGQTLFRSVAEYVFSLDEMVDYIFLQGPLTYKPPHGLAGLFRMAETIPYEATNQQTSVQPVNASALLCWVLARQHMPQPLTARPARVEDFDDLVKVFDEQSEVLTETYGRFFLADLIETQDETHKATVAHAAGDKTVGLMCISTDIDLPLLSNYCDLAPYADLQRNVKVEVPRLPNFTNNETNEEENKLEEDGESGSRASKSSRSSSSGSSSGYSSSNDSKGETSEGGENENENGNNTGEKEEEGEEEEEEEGDEAAESNDTHEDISTDTTKQATKEETSQDGDDEIVEGKKGEGHRGSSGAARHQSILSDVELHTFDEAEHNEDDCDLEADSGDEDVDSSRRGSVHYKAVPNAFALTMFCLDDEYQTNGVTLLRDAFASYPDLEYCVLTLPTTTFETIITHYFTRVPPKHNADFTHMVYLLHRDTLRILPAIPSIYSAVRSMVEPCLSLHIDRATIADIQDGGFDTLVDNMSNPPAVLAMIHETINENSATHLAYGPPGAVMLPKINGHAVGFVVLQRLAITPETKDPVELLDASYKLVESGFEYLGSPWMSVSYCAELVHISVDPTFEHFLPFIIREAMRMFRCSHLVYKATPDMMMPTAVLEHFTLLPARKPPMGLTEVEQDGQDSPGDDTGDSQQAEWRSAYSRATNDSTSVNKNSNRSSPSWRNPNAGSRVSSNNTWGRSNSIPSVDNNGRGLGTDTVGGVEEGDEENEDDDSMIAESGDRRDTQTSVRAKPNENVLTHEMYVKDNRVAVFALCKKMLAHPKTVVNARIVVVGASETGLAVLEHLLLIRHVHFNMLTLIAPGGLPNEYTCAGVRQFSTAGTATTLGFNSARTDGLAFSARVSVVDGTMVRVDRETKHVMLADDTVVAYDHLIIASGLQERTMWENMEDIIDEETHDIKTTSHVHLLRSWAQAKALSEIVDSHYWAESPDFIVYGGTLEAMTAVQGLLQRGVDGSCITLVLPPKTAEQREKEANQVVTEAAESKQHEGVVAGTKQSEGGKKEKEEKEKEKGKENQEEEEVEEEQEACMLPSSSFGGDVKVARFVQNALSAAGVELVDEATIQTVHCDLDTGRVREIVLRITSDPTEDEINELQEGQEKNVTLKCQVLICAGTRDVDLNIFHAVNDAGLVYDGRLVVDEQHHTVDPSIFGAGPLTKFSRKLSPGYSLSECNSTEVGTRVATALFDAIGLDPVHAGTPPVRFTMMSQDLGLEDVFNEAVVHACDMNLPGDLLFFDASLPTCQRLDSVRPGRTIVTNKASSATGHTKYCKIQLDIGGRIEQVVSMGHELRDEEKLLRIVGRHVGLFNDVEAKVNKEAVTDLVEYLTLPKWTTALYHDSFESQIKELELTVNSHDGLQELLSELEHDLGDAVNTRLPSIVMDVGLDADATKQQVKAILGREKKMVFDAVAVMPPEVVLQIESSLLGYVTKFQNEMNEVYLVPE